MSSGYCYCIVLPKPLLLAVRAADRVWLIVSQALFHLGFISTSHSLLGPSWDHVHLISAADSRSPPPPTPSSIKALLPVVEFGQTLSVQEEDEEVMCAVCLGGLQDGDEVRELGNCTHVFHKNCLDKWVDVGNVTCPMCRAELLPPASRRRVIRNLV